MDSQVNFPENVYQNLEVIMQSSLGIERGQFSIKEQGPGTGSRLLLWVEELNSANSYIVRIDGALPQNQQAHFLHRCRNAKEIEGKIADAGLKTSSLLYFGSFEDSVFSISRYIEGAVCEKLAVDVKIPTMWNKIGKELSKLQRISVSGASGLCSSTFSQPPLSPFDGISVDSWISRLRWGVAFCCKNLNLASALTGAIVSRIEELSNYSSPLTLCHGDIALRNALLENRKEELILIDWEHGCSAFYGDYDIAFSLPTTLHVEHYQRRTCYMENFEALADGLGVRLTPQRLRTIETIWLARLITLMYAIFIDDNTAVRAKTKIELHLGLVKTVVDRGIISTMDSFQG